MAFATCPLRSAPAPRRAELLCALRPRCSAQAWTRGTLCRTSQMLWPRLQGAAAPSAYARRSRRARSHRPWPMAPQAPEQVGCRQRLSPQALHCHKKKQQRMKLQMVPRALEKAGCRRPLAPQRPAPRAPEKAGRRLPVARQAPEWRKKKQQRTRKQMAPRAPEKAGRRRPVAPEAPEAPDQRRNWSSASRRTGTGRSWRRTKKGRAPRTPAQQEAEGRWRRAEGRWRRAAAGRRRPAAPSRPNRPRPSTPRRVDQVDQRPPHASRRGRGLKGLPEPVGRASTPRASYLLVLPLLPPSPPRTGALVALT